MRPDQKAALERKKRVLEVLDQALERPPEERLTFVGEACGDDAALAREVEDLLETRTDRGILDGPAFDVHGEDASIGRRVDGYRLVRLLERGGMGVVYLAERQDFEQRVALKLIRRGLDADEVVVRRFHNERQILARLVHPAIARLLDGGTTADRLPYLVMEYVEGEPIDRYCEAKELEVDRRLELFREVCSAVQFAHQNLVIHRDLKPGNILVTAEGKPKLLDFGIAKLLDDSLAARAVETVLGEGPMTPRYASPEQVRLETVTTTSDVYSLGVLLYELLTGLDPYDLDTDRSDEIARAICEREPTKPSTAVRRRAATDARRLRHRLSGDLDAIVLKAMRKEPQERYQSAAELSEDIRRHLEGLPVAARAGSLAYHAGKFVRRYRTAMAVAAGFLLLITTFSVVSTVLWRQTVRAFEKAKLASQKADLEAQKSKTALQFLEELFKGAGPDETQGEELTARELLERGKERIELLGHQPELQIELAVTLAGVFYRLGVYDEAQELMEASLSIVRKRYGGDHVEAAKVMGNLGAATLLLQNPAVAEELFREALAMRRRLGLQPPELFRAKNNLASALIVQGEFEEAKELYSEVLRARVELYGPDDKDVATSRRSLGALYYDRGDFEEAQSELEQALAIRRRVLGPEHTLVASVLDLLGSVMAARGEEDEAERLYNQALAIRRQRLGDDNPVTATTKKNLAALLARSDPASAEELLNQAREVFYRTNPFGWEAADAESVLGTILAGRGRYQEAEPHLVEGYTRLLELRGERSLRTRNALERLRQLYEAWGRPEELEKYRPRSETAAE